MIPVPSTASVAVARKIQLMRRSRMSLVSVTSSGVKMVNSATSVDFSQRNELR